jgi:hypothetical protein
MTLLIIIGYILIGTLYKCYLHHKPSNLEIVVIALWPIFLVYEIGAGLKELLHK